MDVFISQRAFRTAIDTARLAGISDELFLRGIPTSDTLPGRKKRVPWDRYCDLMARIQIACGGPLEVERIGADSFHRSLPEFRLVAGTVITPLALMQAFLRFSAANFPFHYSVSELPDGRIRQAVQLQDGARGSPEFFRGTLGAARGAPGFLSLPLAQVEGEISPRHGVFLSRLPEPRLIAAAVSNFGRTAVRLVRRLAAQSESFLGLGTRDPELPTVEVERPRPREQSLLDRIETYGQILADCMSREAFLDTLLAIVGELGCAQALVLRRAADHAGFHVLAGKQVDPDGTIRLYALRAGGMEVGRLETSVAREAEVLDALVPWIGMGLANWIIPEQTTAAGPRITLHDRLQRASQVWQLSLRQVQVLECMIRGSSNKQIAGQLELVEKTVEFHVGQILRKADVRSRGELASRFFAI